MKLLILASSRLSPFQVDVLDSLLASSNVRMVGAIVDQPVKGARPGPLTRLRRHLAKGRGGYVLVMAAQSLIDRLRRPQPIAATDYFAKRAAGMPVIAVQHPADLYSPATLDFIRRHQPDTASSAAGSGSSASQSSPQPRGA